MRRFTLLTLLALVALPIAAHDRHQPRPYHREAVPSCRPDVRWFARHFDPREEGWSRRPVRYEDRRWEDRLDRYEDRCDDRLVLGPLPRPLLPPLPLPFRGQVIVRFQ